MNERKAHKHKSKTYKYESTSAHFKWVLKITCCNSTQCHHPEEAQKCRCDRFIAFKSESES